MTKGLYSGVGGIAHAINELYVGVDGVARKVTKGYVGVEGVARQFWPMVSPEPNTVEFITTIGVSSWTVKRSGTHRITLVGGGGYGGNQPYQNGGYCGAGGGGSGYGVYLDILLKKGDTYSLYVGNLEQATSGFGAVAGAGGRGGTGYKDGGYGGAGGGAGAAYGGTGSSKWGIYGGAGGSFPGGGAGGAGGVGSSGGRGYGGGGGGGGGHVFEGIATPQGSGYGGAGGQGWGAGGGGANAIYDGSLPHGPGVQGIIVIKYFMPK